MRISPQQVNRPSRRSFLRGVLRPASRQIASVVVQARPENMADIEVAIHAMADLEIYGADPAGKLVIVIDAETDGDLLDTIRAVEALDGVITASLVYHQIEDQIDE